MFLSQEYTIEQYKQLLNDIEFVNKKIYYPEEKPVNKLESLKQKYESSLDSEINTLIKNVGNVLNKRTKEFEDKYKNHLYQQNHLYSLLTRSIISISIISLNSFKYCPSIIFKKLFNPDLSIFTYPQKSVKTLSSWIS